MTRHRVASAADLAPNSMIGVVAGGEEVCLARTDDGTLHAIGNVCTHQYFLLSEGELDGFQVECPQHSSRFDVRTGAVTGLPAVVPARVFAVVEEHGEVFVEA